MINASPVASANKPWMVNVLGTNLSCFGLRKLIPDEARAAKCRHKQWHTLQILVVGYINCRQVELQAPGFRQRGSERIMRKV